MKEGIAADTRRLAATDCLCPEGSPFGRMFSSYHEHVASILLSPHEPRERGRLSVVCLPAFEVEWALRLLGSPKAGYSLVVTVAEQQIGSSRAPETVQAQRLETQVAATIADSIQQVWKKMLLRTRHPEIARIGKDGVRYHFAGFFPEALYMAGTAWSPDPETAPGCLVGLSEALYRYTTSAEADRGMHLQEVRRFLDWFQELA
jgi:hypothetical protein